MIAAELRFDAGDQPKDFGNLASIINSNGYIAPKPLKEKDIDFEIEYMDSASRSKFISIFLQKSYGLNI